MVTRLAFEERGAGKQARQARALQRGLGLYSIIATGGNYHRYCNTGTGITSCAKRQRTFRQLRLKF